MRTWYCSVGGKDHAIQVAHDPVFFGELEIYVDGQEIVNTVIPSGRDYEHGFRLEGKSGIIRVLFRGMSVAYQVQVEGEALPYSGAEDLVSPS